MTISELVAKLKEIKEEHGDLKVFTQCIDIVFQIIDEDLVVEEKRLIIM